MCTYANQVLKECKQCKCLSLYVYLQCLAFIFSHTGKLLSNIGEKLPKWLKGPFRRAWDTLKKKGPKFLRDPEFGQFIKNIPRANIQSKIKNIIQDFILDQLNDLGYSEQLKNYWMGFVEWIASLDPVSNSHLHFVSFLLLQWITIYPICAPVAV